jgi:hypothetical protein
MARARELVTFSLFSNFFEVGGDGHYWYRTSILRAHTTSDATSLREDDMLYSATCVFQTIYRHGKLFAKIVA